MGTIGVLAFLGIFGGMFWFVWSALKKQVTRVFPDNYSELSHKWGTQGLLNKYRGLSGYLTTQTPERVFPNMSFRFRGLLKLDVYESMLLVSALGQGVCIPYTQYSIKKEDGFISYLVIENLPVSQGADSVISGSSLDFDKTTTLKIMLPKKKIDFILSFVQKARQHTPVEQPPQ